MKVIAITAVIVLLTACVISRHTAAPEPPPLTTVAHEIGRYPNAFQKGCLGSTAMYKARPDGEIDVLNSCRNEQDGSLREAATVAWPVFDGNVRGLVAFVSGSTINAEQILSGLKQRLPAYSVPRRIIFIAQMPLNQNGKVDRGALVRILESG